jgi:WD40 repeat protein
LCGESCKEFEREYMHPMMFDVHGSSAVYVRFDTGLVTMTDAASGTVETKWLSDLARAARSDISHVAFVHSGKHVVVISQSMRANEDNQFRKCGFTSVHFFDTETSQSTYFPGKKMFEVEGIASASEAFKVVLWSTCGRIATFRRGCWCKDEEQSTCHYAVDYGEDVQDEYHHIYTTSASFFEDDVKVSSCAVSPNGYWCAMSRADGSVAMLKSAKETPFWTEAWSQSFEGTKETDLAFAAAGKLLVCHDRRDKIKLLVAATGLLVGETKLSFPLKGPCVGKPVIVRDHETEAEEDAGTSTTRKSEDVFSILCVGEQGQIARFEGAQDGTLVAKCSISLAKKQTQAAISPSGSLVACADTDGTVTILNARTGLPRLVRSTRANAFAIQFAKTGSVAASTDKETAKNAESIALAESIAPA